MATLSIIDPLRGSIAFDDAAQVVAALDVLTNDTTGRFQLVRYKNKYHPDTPRPIPFRNVMVNMGGSTKLDTVRGILISVLFAALK